MLRNAKVTVDNKLCYTFAPDYHRPIATEITCNPPLVGRKVRIQKDNDTSLPFLALCQVQVWVCNNNYYGFDCTNTCGNCSGGTCQPWSGECPRGCSAGYQTPGCEAGYQPPLCKEFCTNDSYGLNCSNTCGNCSEGTSCNPVSGECPLGKAACPVVDNEISTCTRPTMTTKCTDGYVVAGCTHTCGRCSNRAPCISTTELCPTECEDGWQTDQCKASKGLPIGRSTVRVALVRFDSRVEIINGFLDSLAVFTESVCNMTYPSNFGTNTGGALRTVRETVLEGREKEDGVKDVVITITDGMSEDPDATKEETTLLREQGVQLVWLYVYKVAGPIVDEKNFMDSQGDTVTWIESFRDLSDDVFWQVLEAVGAERSPMMLIGEEFSLLTTRPFSAVHVTVLWTTDPGAADDRRETHFSPRASVTLPSRRCPRRQIVREVGMDTIVLKRVDIAWETVSVAGPVAGAAVGCAVVFFIIGAVFGWWLRKSRFQQPSANGSSPCGISMTSDTGTSRSTSRSDKKVDTTPDYTTNVYDALKARDDNNTTAYTSLNFHTDVHR
ncbi:hypothetical protein C0Q70_15143 [Pomacea canaliculata]|uniref:VWFA domain-containing protein n=1 Tax=Pomacea canaliculata TaxID=400727 RepID=A0A2T7NU05_POMCA|nr:hypothetical protein C0Q70_15143 [Pomacea canaliculata]